jgi:hypothetical protein
MVSFRIPAATVQNILLVFRVLGKIITPVIWFFMVTVMAMVVMIVVVIVVIMIYAVLGKFVLIHHGMTLLNSCRCS